MIQLATVAVVSLALGAVGGAAWTQRAPVIDARDSMERFEAQLREGGVARVATRAVISLQASEKVGGLVPTARRQFQISMQTDGYGKARADFIATLQPILEPALDSEAARLNDALAQLAKGRTTAPKRIVPPADVLGALFDATVCPELEDNCKGVAVPANGLGPAAAPVISVIATGLRIAFEAFNRSYKEQLTVRMGLSYDMATAVMDQTARDEAKRILSD